MSLDTDTVEGKVLLGCARLLGARSALTWREDESPYAAGERGVVIGPLPATGQAVAIDLYDDQPIDSSSTWLFLQAQVRGSGDVLDRDALAAVRDGLDGQHHPAMPAGVFVTLIRLQSEARLGLVAGSYRWSLNFRLLTARSSAWAT